MREDIGNDVGFAGREPGPALFSVIGLQNSGKTRFVLSTIRLLRARGLTVAVLKHDGHADAARTDGGAEEKQNSLQILGRTEDAEEVPSSTAKRHVLDWEKQGSDTTLALNAGAMMTMVTGGGQSLLHFADDTDSSQVHNLTKRMAELAEHSGQPLDVIIVEGFKKSKLPKVFICRNKEHVSWLREHRVDNLQVVVMPEEVQDTADLSWPIFDESQMEAILQACGVRF